MPFIIIMLLLLIHELGHFLSAYFLGIEIKKISIYPYGGIANFNIEFNESIFKEFIILIMGPIFQFIGFFILMNCSFFDNYTQVIKVYHYSILIFNLLPIYPLDGGKLLNLFLNLNFSFKRSLTISLYFSYFIILIMAIIFFPDLMKINILLIIILLLYKVFEEYKKRNYYFEKFLLERYLNNYNFKKLKEVKTVNDFKKEYKHIIKDNNNYYTEKEILRKKFKHY